MGAKGSVEAAKMNADNWGHIEVCIRVTLRPHSRVHFQLSSLNQSFMLVFKPCMTYC